METAQQQIVSITEVPNILRIVSFLLQATHRGLHFAQLQSGNGAMVKRLIDGAPPVCEATVFFDDVCQVNVDRYRTRHFSHTSTGGQPCPHIPIS